MATSIILTAHPTTNNPHKQAVFTPLAGPMKPHASVHSSASNRWRAIIEKLRTSVSGMTPPASWLIVEKYGRDPFLVLVSCVLSLRTKDTVSFPASCRLFERVRTPYALLQLRTSEIEKLIYPVGFYRQKAAQLKAISQALIDRFDGQVPSTMEELLTLKGVGRKTANLTLAEGFQIPAICVDVHVHRISNRLGLVNTKTPEETEMALRELLPPEYWAEYNGLLVMWGQNICVPVSPFCSKCPIAGLCDRVGVIKSR